MADGAAIVNDDVGFRVRRRVRRCWGTWSRRKSVCCIVDVGRVVVGRSAEVMVDVLTWHRAHVDLFSDAVLFSRSSIRTDQCLTSRV
jgi:hypothetical protein